MKEPRRGSPGSLARLCSLLLYPLLLIGCTPKTPPGYAPLTFNRDLKPFMVTYCIECHGQEAQEAGLDLRSVKLMRRGGETGPALVPGKPGESLLLDMVLDDHMPPDGEMPTARETNLLTRWILQGAN
jgi:hypothetical protein